MKRFPSKSKVCTANRNMLRYSKNYRTKLMNCRISMKMIHGMNKQIDRYVSSFLSILLGFTLFLAGCTLDEQNNSEVADKPNILLILVDDMGYGDLKSYNPQSKIPTPNLDRLATEGMHFTDAHAPGAVCHPSWYGLLTGRYPFRTNTNVWPE